MEPVELTSVPFSKQGSLQNPAFQAPGVFEQARKCCLYAPIPILSCVAIGGAGFGLATAFGTTASTTTGTLPSAVAANIAYDAFAALAALFSGSCYWHNMPLYSFEEDIQREDAANKKAAEVEGKTAQDVSDYHTENGELKAALAETKEKMEALESALEEKRQDLIKLQKELKETLKELTLSKADFNEAKRIIKEAKKLVTMMMKSSEQMKSNIKASNTALTIFSKYNLNFDKEVKHLSFENKELSKLLNHYSNIIETEHSDFLELIKVCDQLEKNCQELKQELNNFSKDTLKMTDDTEKEIQNTAKLEAMEKDLAALNKNFEHKFSKSHI